MKQYDSSSLMVITENSPGRVYFSNFDAVKNELENRLSYYTDFEYTLDDYDYAEENVKELKYIKKAIADKRDEIKAAFKDYLDVMDKFDELLDMVKVPLKTASDFVKENEKAKKSKEIEAFAREKAKELGDFAEKILSSPAFFNPKWKNVSCRAKQWQSDVIAKIEQAKDDIESIKMTAGKNASALLAHYYQTLSLEGSSDFIEAIEENDDTDDNCVEKSEQTLPIGFKVLKIYANERQMLQIMTQFDMLGLDVEELENGMPEHMQEITEPDFDSFIAFDIEHTGTFGASKGDEESEIIEIGAVKVIDGVVIEKFDELCNPGRKIVPRIAKLTHISDEMVEDMPPVSDIIKEFKEFVGDLPLVGHNIKACDIPHISRAADRAGVAFENKYFDTNIFAKQFKKQYNWENTQLTTLSRFFEIEQKEAHRAWCDAEANAYVYLELKKLNS